MKIADRTPFRNESGEIDLVGRMRGTLKFGLGWYARLQAQDTVIAVLEKILGQNFILLRNVTLPDTDIDLPLVLIGPPGIYLINVTDERGVYRARDDEWGTISGEKFVPAAINQVQRTVKLAKVLQIYLDRAGYKGSLIVEPILMAADPGMHIESVRSAVRVVMSDALERFAITINQIRPALNTGLAIEIAQIIVKGPKKATAAAPELTPASPAPVESERDSTDVSFLPTHPDSSQAFSTESTDFSFFDENSQDQPTPAQSEQQDSANRAAAQSGSNEQNLDRWDTESPIFDMSNADDPNRSFFDSTPEDSDNSQSNDKTVVTEPQPPTTNKPASGTRKKVIFGLTTTQTLILVGILLLWLCAMVGFALFIFFNR